MWGWKENPQSDSNGHAEVKLGKQVQKESQTKGTSGDSGSWGWSQRHLFQDVFILDKARVIWRDLDSSRPSLGLGAYVWFLPRLG